MTSLFWYICLALIGIVSAMVAMYKKRHVYKVSTLVVFYLFTASFTWIGEFTVLGLFDAYAYKTGVFTDPWAQNLLGHLLINTTLYPAAAIIMVAYSLRFGWIFSVAAAYTLIEFIFIRMGIYEQHWWRYYMTFSAVVFFLLFYHVWFAKMNEKRYGITRAITFYFAAMLLVHTPAPILLLMGKQHYQLSFVNNWVGNLYLASIIIIFFYHLIEALLLVLCTCVLKKWYWSLLPMIVSAAVQILLVRMNILVIENSWNLIYTLVLYELFIVIYVLVEKSTLKPDFYRFGR